jgi:hypothetical protein
LKKEYEDSKLVSTVGSIETIHNSLAARNVGQKQLIKSKSNSISMTNLKVRNSYNYVDLS